MFFPEILFLGNCGLEEYPNVLAIPQSNITQVFNNYAEVRIYNIGFPASDYSTTTHFVIFYRIYVSDVPISSTTISDNTSYSAINSVLNTDFNSIRPYIDSDTLVNVNMDNMFRGRGYKYLELEPPSEIDNVLGYSAVRGRTLVFNFESAREPYMTIDGAEYILWRSDGNGTFFPRPDRYFVNKDELWDSDNLVATINEDVANKSNMSGADRYTYAAMYIVAVGLDTNTYSNIYSTPALIHVFQLPD